MTNKEAKRRMEICRDFLANNYSDMGEPNFMAFNMAIQALEQEPYDDCISRQAVLDELEKPMNWTDSEAELQEQRDYYGFIDLVQSMPSVTPKTSEGYISKAALLEKIDEERKYLLDLKMDGAEHIIVHHARRIIEDMPTVTPKAGSEG